MAFSIDCRKIFEKDYLLDYLSLKKILLPPEIF